MTLNINKKTVGLGVLVTAVVAGVIAHHVINKKYVDPETGETSQPVKEKIEAKLTNGMVKAVMFVTEHVEQVQAVGTALGVVGTVISIVIDIKAYNDKKHTDIELITNDVRDIKDTLQRMNDSSGFSDNVIPFAA
jgi:hypothetical protein